MDHYTLLAGRVGILFLAVSAATMVIASPLPATAPVLPSSMVAQPATPPASLLVIPALTPITLEIDKALSSKVSKQGDIFPLRLAEPIVIDGHVMVRAGAEGIGEVIDAKHGGMSGSSGVLILVAHYLTVDGRQLRLRSMHIAQTGADNRTTAMVVGVAFGVVGLFVTGGDTLVTAGTIARAKTAEDFTVDANIQTFQQK